VPGPADAAELRLDVAEVEDRRDDAQRHHQPVDRLAWGWESLTQGAPLSAPVEDPSYKYQKVIILLTDGLNTQNRWTTDQATIDARQALLCNNVKAAGITLYTIQVNTGGTDPTSTLLQNCASDASKTFMLTQASAIVTVFNQIGTNLSKLRVAK